VEGTAEFKRISMATARQKPQLLGPRVQTRTARSPVLRKARLLIRLIFTFGCAGALHVALPHAAAVENLFPGLDDSNSAGAASEDSPFGSEADDVKRALLDQLKIMAQGPRVDPPAPISRNGLVLLLVLVLAGALAFWKLFPAIAHYLNEHFNPWAVSPAAAANFSATIRAEDQAFSEFLVEFRTGPSLTPGNAQFGVASATECDPLKAFLARTPKLLGEIQKLLQEVGRASNDPTRRRMLADLQRELRALKGEAGLSELLPVWQLAAAVEGLVKQLIDNAGNVTASTLRTVGGGVDLLVALCAPGLRADLLTHPPLRLLAVDDDLISRNAIVFALKKALNPPDLAVDGESALALATQHAYDVIFLDVQMPGMDGFEVCTRIHDTGPNATTPVVFVTCQSDFEARVQSTLSGGSDLIGKAFLTFEITVKALTLALQGRLQGRAQTAGARHEVNGFTALSPALAKISLVQNPLQELTQSIARAALPEMLMDGDCQGQSLTGRDDFAVPPPGADPAGLARRPLSTPVAAAPPHADRSTAACDLAPNELVQAFLARAATLLGPLRDLIQAIFQTADENARQEMLADFYLRLHALTPQIGSAEGHPALRLCAALQGLLKKFFENPTHCTSSALLTVATAVDLLHDLCAPAVKADLATNPPIRLLVVDDDPVALRVIGSALQMAFEKPESADCGEAALALANEKPFDAIFLDVQMPGLDGFTTCLRIHETAQNRGTPVVFVTGHSDFKARSQAGVSGGSDFIAKPFLKAEIIVKALAFALRGRLQKHKTAQNRLLLPGNEEPKQASLAPALG